jgi:hypothetical protein
MMQLLPKALFRGQFFPNFFSPFFLTFDFVNDEYSYSNTRVERSGQSFPEESRSC